MLTLDEELTTYSLTEIDTQLGFLGNLLKYSKKANREKVVERADQWLDKRLELKEE